MATWKMDTAHSEVKFKVKHLVVSTVSGNFDKFSATVESNKPDFSDATITFEADVNSISTKSEQRDGHLKSPDFFDVAQFGEATFEATSVTYSAENVADVVGNLVVKGVSVPVKFPVKVRGLKDGKLFAEANFSLDSAPFSKRPLGVEIAAHLFANK